MVELVDTTDLKSVGGTSREGSNPSFGTINKKSMKFLVIGDSCTDRFIYGECDRICPEAPVPVFNPVDTKTSGGMAANVYANILALDHDCDLMSNKSSIVKSRYVDTKTNQMLLRVDEQDFTADRFTDCTVDYDMYDAIIISDYNKGFVSNIDIAKICSSHEYVFVDSKKNFLTALSSDMKFLKINQYEYDKNREYFKEDNKQHNGLWLDKLIVTSGSNGCWYQRKRVPLRAEREARDLSGAGDTFLAAFVTSYMNNKDTLAAITFAQECASEVVSKKGVVTI